MAYFMPGVDLRDGKQGLLDADGSSLVIHEGSDDYESDPSGASGGRIACGVVEPGADTEAIVAAVR